AVGCAQGGYAARKIPFVLPREFHHRLNPRPAPAIVGERLGAYIGSMAGHTHREHTGAQLIEEAEAVLVRAGEQWTAMRADVFEALAALDRPASAYDIAEAVGDRRGKRVAANSVYRILDLFVRTNLANRVESANA